MHSCLLVNPVGVSPAHQQLTSSGHLLMLYRQLAVSPDGSYDMLLRIVPKATSSQDCDPELTRMQLGSPSWQAPPDR